MLTSTSIDIPVKPRILITDDSRIVRATLIKHIEGMFEFREALDGEQAWETLLIDPSIRVVITDLTMPKLDGYGLLQRIRASKINRIRNIPVVVVSGSDEQSERDRAKAAGATDLITKGISTAQLLSRLDVLSKLANTQREFGRGLEALVQNTYAATSLNLSSPEALVAYAGTILESALQHKKNFVILNVCIALKKQTGLDSQVVLPPLGVVNAIGQLLQRTVRQTDKVAQTGQAEFTLATGSINFDTSRYFARRVCAAIANANLIEDDCISCVTSCGLVCLSEYSTDIASVTLGQMREVAHRRATLGLDSGIAGVVGMEEEILLQQEGVAIPATTGNLCPSLYHLRLADKPESSSLSFDLTTLLQWAKEGKQEQVLQYIAKLSPELQFLVDLLLQQARQL